MAIADIEHPRIAVRSRLLGRFFKGDSDDDSGNSGEGNPPIEGVVTEHKLLQYFFKLKGLDVQPIATDTFLDKSRSTYNPAWLSREIIQNFVDHNPEHPGTLDGVHISSENLASGSTRFKIVGDWPFRDNTGVTTPHSDKPEDMNTAGGNGIGLKQTAILLMRDYGVERFEIAGEGWNVNYRLAKAKDVNNEWAAIPGQVPLYQIEHNWLLAEMKPGASTGRNEYIIETQNPEVIYALSQLNTLGVSRENPYLQSMDFESEHGALKWLPREGEMGVSKGRLFVNGQVMNFKSQGETVEDYWRGPEGVTIQLNDLKYRMSIDRAPISSRALSGYLDKMVGSMTEQQMIEQLMRSEYLWAGHPEAASSYDRPGYSVVLEKVVKALSQKIADKEQAAAFFASKGYLAWDKTVSESQIKDLRAQGYIICSGYFEQIGMPSAGAKLSNAEAASNEVPQLTRAKREQIAQELGVEVAYRDFSAEPLTKFIETASIRLEPYILKITPSPSNPKVLRISFRGDIPSPLLSHPLPRPKENNQIMLYLLRGVAAYGLSTNLFKKVFASQGEFITTFALDYDLVTKENNLLARNIPSKSDQGVFMEIEFADEQRSDFQARMEKTLAEFKEYSQKALVEAEDSLPALRDKLAEQLATETGEVVGGAEDQNPKPIEEVKAVGPNNQAIAVQTDDVFPKEGEKVTTIGEVTKPSAEVPDPNEVLATKGVEGQAWSNEEEALYQQAIKKNPDELSGVERLIIQRIKDLRASLQSVPVVHPEAPTLVPRGQTIHKESTLPEAEQERLTQMEEQLPGIVEAVNKLDQLVPEVKPAELTGQSDIEKYLAWRNSPDFYGELGDNAGYLTGKHLLELVDEQDQAEIDSTQPIREKSPNEKILGALHDKLKAVVDRINPSEDEVNDFEIVLSPAQKELAQLGLLRMYVHLLTGAALPNDLFIYQGTGSKGINLGKKAIGLHQSLFETQFTESLRTFIHEVAHNVALNHENEFRHAMESLFVTVIDRVGEVGRKLEAREPLDLTDRIALDIQGQWNLLRQAA